MSALRLVEGRGILSLTESGTLRLVTGAIQPPTAAYDDSLPDDSLLMLDPDTYFDALSGLLGMFGVNQDFIDGFMASVGSFYGGGLEQPTDLKAATRNISNAVLLLFAINAYNQYGVGQSGYQTSGQVSDAIAAALDGPPYITSDQASTQASGLITAALVDVLDRITALEAFRDGLHNQAPIDRQNDWPAWAVYREGTFIKADGRLDDVDALRNEADEFIHLQIIAIVPEEFRPVSDSTCVIQCSNNTDNVVKIGAVIMRNSGEVQVGYIPADTWQIQMNGAGWVTAGT